MAPRDALIGQRLADFRIERVLGRGGMAKVYFGWDLKLNRPVAIKVIDERFRHESSYVARFVREASTIATWQHPNIPQVYQMGEEDGIAFFAMEYLHGLDLEQRLQQYTQTGQRLPYGDILRIAKAVASALDYAHRKGIIHRDVKPSNVILSEDGRILLTDFGLAMYVVQGTLGEVFGSPHYMAPEQARSSAEAVSQSDLYSLGVMLYEMLTGQLPFEDPSPTSLALKHITLEPPAPREINPELSPAVEAVLVKALRKSPLERYQSGRDLTEAMEAAFMEEKEGSQPVTLPMVPETPEDLPPETQPMVSAESQENGRSIEGRDDEARRPEYSPPETQPLVTAEPLENAQPLEEQAGELRSPESPPVVKPVPRLSRANPRLLPAIGCGLLLLLLGSYGSILGLSFSLYRNSTPTETSPRGAATTPALALVEPPSGTIPAPIAIATEPRATPSPTPTNSPHPTSTATEAPAPAQAYELQMVAYKDDSLFVVNRSPIDFPVALLRLTNRSGKVLGIDWKVDHLETDECVAVWKEEGRPQAPEDLECDVVGERLKRSGPEKFWMAVFEVYFEDRLIQTCDTRRGECLVLIPLDRP